MSPLEGPLIPLRQGPCLSHQGCLWCCGQMDVGYQDDFVKNQHCPLFLAQRPCSEVPNKGIWSLSFWGYVSASLLTHAHQSQGTTLSKALPEFTIPERAHLRVLKKTLIDYLSNLSCFIQSNRHVATSDAFILMYSALCPKALTAGSAETWRLICL